MATASIRVFVFNEKEVLEEGLKKGQDFWNQNTNKLLDDIISDGENILNRRKEIVGFGTICAEGQFVDLLDEALRSYQLGFYYATIALCGMTVERICYDLIDFSNILVNDTELQRPAKQELYNIPLRHLIDFLNKIHIIDEASKVLLFKINDRRNSYVHPKMDRRVQDDAFETINLLCRAIKAIFKNLVFTTNSSGTISMKVISRISG
ncbi:MAG TPA: hypothetical protein VH500_22695 [Nitrososphaeraceae archaeon]|jgi:hypothetical protein